MVIVNNGVNKQNILYFTYIPLFYWCFNKDNPKGV